MSLPDQAVHVDAPDLLREPNQQMPDRPFLELRAVDLASIDVPWNGLSPAVQISRMVEAYEIKIALHNCYRDLADLHSPHL
jgi:hypothetical protein